MNLLVDICERYWVGITLLILTIITIGSLMPLRELPALPGSDKTHHLFAYAALVFCSALHKPKHWLFLVLGFALWSGAIELIQPYVNRYGEWRDLLANCVGLGLGVSFAELIRFWLRKAD